MEDSPSASPCSPSEDYNDMMTSFSNPNYTLADTLNSNLPQNLNLTSSQYTYNSADPDDNSHLYEDVRSPMSSSQMLDDLSRSSSSTATTDKSRKKYADMDLSSMGIELPQGNLDRRRKNGSLIDTPDSMTSLDSDSVYSGGITSPEAKILAVGHTEEGDTEDDSETPYAEWKPKGFLGYYASMEREGRAKSGEKETGRAPEEEGLIQSTDEERTPNSPSAGKDDKVKYDDKTKVINSPDSNDSGIQADVQHIHGPLNDDIYAVVQKTGKKPKPEKPQEDKKEEDHKEEEDVPSLPPGWEKHEDDDGPYYWHIKSGTIQRDPPPPAPPERALSTRSDSSVASSDSERPPTLSERSLSSSASEPGLASTNTATDTTPGDQHLQEFEGHAFKYATESLKSLKNKEEKEKDRRPRSTKESELPIRFAVRSLGWVRVAEEDLTPERSSKAVNKCIVDLSLGRNDINDVVGRWGDGKDLYMDLDDQNLVLIDPTDVSVLNVQPIQSIRVWGVGRDNGRDFAYVARDRITRKHMCHVFRCDTPARQIANTLRDICQKIMLERSKGIVSSSTEGSGGNSAAKNLGITRPNNLPVHQMPDGQKITFESLFNNTSFPTPMEEPKKVIRCHYLGTAQVMRPTGIEVLNGAAEKVYSRVPPEKWVFVSVAVAPSTITITEHGKSDNILAECRVRFLSFMGIAQKNVKLCTFIMHTAQDQFVAHVFHCEPSAGALCKTIEAACKLRYQKCLDSHHNQISEAKKLAAQQQQHSKTPEATKKNQPPPSQPSPSTATQGLTAQIKSGTAQIKAGALNLFDIIKKKTNTGPEHHS